MKFEVGEWAEWKSSAQGTVKTKTAECVAVIQAKGDQHVSCTALNMKKFSYATVDQYSMPRDHESYLFAMPAGPKGGKRRVYWPRVKNLRKVEVKTCEEE